MDDDRCRICWEKDDVGVLLSNQYQEVYDIVDIIHKLTSLQIELSDDLPRFICKQCADKLVDFYLFRQQILEAENKLSIKTEPLEDPRLKLETEIAFVSVKEECEDNLVLATSPGNNQLGSVGRRTRRATAKESKKRKPATRKSQVKPANADHSVEAGSAVENVASQRTTDQVSADVQVATQPPTTTGKKTKRYICEKCGRALRGPKAFLSHFRGTHLKQIERKKCPYCPRYFTVSAGACASLARHIKAVHNGQQKTSSQYPTIKCVDCEDYFWGPLEMYEHSKLHDKESKERDDGYDLNCDNCKMELDSYESFANHMREVHGIMDEKDMRPVRCRWCGERCRSMQGLHGHIRLVHRCEDSVRYSVASSDKVSWTPYEKPSSFLCTVCGKELSTPATYKGHMDSHVGHKPFACEICPAKFSHQVSLILHKRSHKNERKHHCSECPKTFNFKAHLKNHLITHGIGIKEKFACGICNKEFLFRGALKEHMWVHNKGINKPHICDHCGQGFVRKHKLRDHKNKEHFIENNSA